MSSHDAPQPARQAAEPRGTLDAAPAASREELLEMHAAAQAFFCDRLDTSWGPAYLTGRGFTERVAKAWSTGYAPGRPGTALLTFLEGRGFSREAIEDSGLAVRTKDGRRLIDRFRDRLMLPITDEHGATVAFIGRISVREQQAAERANRAFAKYLNSPETALYHKGDVLFGLWQAEQRFATGVQPVLVEGPWDAIAVSTDPRYAGLATCGTALTDRHVAALARHASLADLGVIAAFDGDAAGQKAMRTAYRKLTLFTDDTYAIRLPPGRDPADLLAKAGPGSLAAHLDQPDQLADAVVDAVIDALVYREDGYRVLDHVHGQLQVLRGSTAVLVGMPAADVHRQIHRIAGRLNGAVPGLNVAEVRAAYADASAGGPDTADVQLSMAEAVAAHLDPDRVPGTAKPHASPAGPSPPEISDVAVLSMPTTARALLNHQPRPGGHAQEGMNRLGSRPPSTTVSPVSALDR